eukprot:1684480-Heterocapsa_arctica.AAC.1
MGNRKGAFLTAHAYGSAKQKSEEFITAMHKGVISKLYVGPNSQGKVSNYPIQHPQHLPQDASGSYVQCQDSGGVSRARGKRAH